MKHAYIENGIVKEVARVDPFSIFRHGYASLFVQCPDEVEPGWRHDGDTFESQLIVAATIVPQSVSMRQAELALFAADLLGDIEALVLTLPKTDQITWNRASSVERNNPLVKYVQTVKSMTDLQIDELFIAAAKL